MRWNVQSVQDWFFRAFLIGAVVASIILNIINLNVKWYIPAIFMALYLIYQTLIDRQPQQGDLESSFYGSNSEFYSSTQRRMQSATRHIWVTYVRLVPPPGFESPEADSYFKYGLEWARKNPDRELRRIVGAQDDGPVSEWLLRHYIETRDIKNYFVRVSPFSGPVDGINFAIIDDRAIFLALSGEGNRLTGHSLATPEAVHAFREYFLQWWDSAEKLEEYVRRVTADDAICQDQLPPSVNP
jgi:hypothetical protein